MVSRLALRTSLLLCVAAALVAQVEPGIQILTFHSEIDDSGQPYGLYVPKSFNAARKYPLVISLHGEFADHRTNLRQVFGKIDRLREIQPVLPEIDCIVACPYARGEIGYPGIPEEDVYGVLADVKRRYPIDDSRVYLTGISLGGGGALWLGLTRPGLWAALAPVSPEPPPGTQDLAPNALNLPIRLFQGDQDPVLPVEQTRQWYKRLLDAGGRVEYLEFPGVRHDAWYYAYKDGAIFNWFTRFRRPAHPDRVSFETRMYKYGTAYWAQLDSFTPGDLASIDARFTGENKLAISTSKLDGFTLALAGHPQFARALPLLAVIDGNRVRARAAAPISFKRTPAGWRVGHAVPGQNDKHKGAEGPISDAIAARQIYVYGVADDPGPDELSRRQQIARQAAAWPQPDGRVSLSFPVKSDGQVSAQDLEDSNLVLFGTKETNRIISRLAGQLPLALNPGAADYGLVFVAPAGERYVVVNSGLSWWTGADEARRPDMHGVTPPPYRVLGTFGDFILFKGSLANIVAEGRFDRHWKVPAAAAGAMRSTGTVVIQ
jgi:pimeloyl-ACP methyl ester carboxylesterase